MKFPLLASVVVMSAVISPLCHAANKRSNFEAPPLSAFDGKQWGNLKIGETTFKDIQPVYETGAGYFDRSSELTQAKNSPLRIDCLWYKDTDKREVLGAIAVQFKGAGVGQDDILKAFGPPRVPEPLIHIQLNTDEEPNGEPQENQEPMGEENLGPDEELPAGVEALYQAGRFEQWRVLRFADKGVAAFQLRIGDAVSTPMLIFASKEGIGTLTQKLSAEYSPVERRFDPNEGKPKIAEFSNAFADYDLRGGNRVPQSWRDQLKDRIQAATADGTLTYRLAGGGTYKVSVTGKGDVNDDGSYSVTATISSIGPYGPITATGSGSSSWSRRKNSDNPDRVESAFRSATSQAMGNAEDSFAKQINNSGPPPLDVVRRQQWSALVDVVRNYSGLAPIRF